MNSDEEARRRRGRIFVLAYPFALLGICIVLNVFVFRIQPPEIALPDENTVMALVAAAVLLLINHTWLMTTTELTRGRFGMYATPEEWRASGRKREDTVREGWDELERRHNAHRNTTENTIYFVFVASVFAIVSPPVSAVLVWIVGFAVARLGYTYSYLAGKDGLRGLFMSLSLLCLFGIASGLVLGFLA
ncbi:MAG: MAPEG family protein [Roseibium sp.]|uniref:MAPEG family protein n=1 Tax=Roseibium sp. TaxID=1936156 RepID=UPI0026375CA5|nr:MAPEG family protein [Roseibium sp.]MCV0428463.1 MAPEG family protein [Roseibium sp.]